MPPNDHIKKINKLLPHRLAMIFLVGKTLLFLDLKNTISTYFMGIINFPSLSYLEEKENPELP
jgi:hypothetical protein